MNKNKKDAIVGSILSIIPGLGHIYFKKWVQALSLFVVNFAIYAGLFMSDSIIIQVVVVVVYILVLFSSILDMRTFAGISEPSRFKDSKRYITFLLLTIGVNALPFLWQSKAYGKTGKIIWTIVTPIMGILFLIGVFFLVKSGV